MTPSGIDAYVEALSSELVCRGMSPERLLPEVRDHLADAIQAARHRGLSHEAAEQEALVRFGTPALVAERYADGRFRMLNRVVFALAIAAGIAIAYVDSRPHWDDAGITAFSMLIAAGICGLVAPQKPWLWAMGVGIWIPAHAMARTLAPGSIVMLVLLAFPLAGAYAGALVRRTLAP
jgi:hypothetical protein